MVGDHVGDLMKRYRIWLGLIVWIFVAVFLWVPMNWLFGLNVFDFNKWIVVYLILALFILFVGILSQKPIVDRLPVKRSILYGVFLIAVPIVFLAIIETGLFAYTQKNERWRHLYGNFSAYGDVEELREFMDDAREYRGHRPRALGIPGFRVYAPAKSEHYYVNNMGFRTREFVDKAVDEWRIGVVGGSTTWGSWVSNEETIPNNIERLLRSKNISSKTISVYNLGIEGASIHMERKVAEKLYPIVLFDQLIFYDGVNDFPADYLAWRIDGRENIRVEQEMSGEKIVSKEGQLSPVLDEILDGKTAKQPFNPLVRSANWATRLTAKLADFEIVQSLKYLVRRGQLITVKWSESGLDDVLASELTDRAANAYLAQHDKAVQFCKKNQLRCDFIIQPFMGHKPLRTSAEARIYGWLLERTPDYVRQYDAVAKKVLAERHNIWDLRDAVIGERGDVFADTAHMTKLGNRIIAETIVDRLW